MTDGLIEEIGSAVQRRAPGSPKTARPDHPRPPAPSLPDPFIPASAGGRGIIGALELANSHVALQAISLKIGPGLVEHDIVLLGAVAAIGFERDLTAQ